MQRSATQRNFIRSMCRSTGARWPDLAERGFGFLHPGNRFVTVFRDYIGAIAEHKGVGALWIGRPQILTLEPASEMERHEGDALADALRHEILHPRLRAVLGAGYPRPGAVSDAALGGIPRVDLHEHLLLQLGQPPVRARLCAAALVLDEPTGGEDQRKVLRDAFLDRRLLHAEADIRQPELSGKIGRAHV